ncbi:hypothetical protein GCM10027199_82130 [Amycolatopsis magusensis]
MAGVVMACAVVAGAAVPGMAYAAETAQARVPLRVAVQRLAVAEESRQS